MENYCIKGTSVRTGKRVEINNPDCLITTKQEAEKVKNAFKIAFDLIENKEYTMKNIRIAKK